MCIVKKKCQKKSTMPPTNLNLHVCMALKRRVNEHKQSPLLSVPFLGISIKSFTGNHCTTPGPSVSLPLLCCRWFSTACWLCSDTTGVSVGESTNRETSRPNLFNFVRVLSDVFFPLFSLFSPHKFGKVPRAVEYALPCT